jgi:hypothetical protein
MMKSSDLQSFAPKDNVGLNLGKMTIYVYPHISEEMSTNEKLYSFLVNKSALEMADVNPKVRLQSFIDLTGTTSLVGILQARYADHALNFICQAQSFIIRSCHSSNGLIIPNCTQASLLKLKLKPITGRPIFSTSRLPNRTPGNTQIYSPSTPYLSAFLWKLGPS